MFMLRMISGLLAGAWVSLRRRGPAARSARRPAPRAPEADGDLYAGALGLERAAAFHARAARRSVEDLDGEGVLEHMRHFRRYSSACDNRDARRGGQAHSLRCTNCGLICASGDMRNVDPSAGPHLFPAGQLVCAACDPTVATASWTARDGRRVPVWEMGDRHLAESAAAVRRWLRAGTLPVNDDRIRMCGHVLVECARRGIAGEVGNG